VDLESTYETTEEMVRILVVVRVPPGIETKRFQQPGHRSGSLAPRRLGVTAYEVESMRSEYLRMVLISLFLSQLTGCASPREYSKFRYVGDATKSEDDFLIDRARCKTQAPPVPIVKRYMYQNCMLRRDWIITE
jgi:hypothetical protein